MAAELSRIEGAEEMARVLRRLPARLAERDLLNAVRAAANRVRREAKARAPRGAGPPHPKYGRLAGNIKTTRARPRALRGQDRGLAEGPGEIAVAIHTGRAFWGLFLEFGTSRMAPRPWFRPALNAAAQPALDAMGKRLGRNIERTAGELAGRFGAIRKSTRRRL